MTALTDGHPGVSGGGVLDQRGNLVVIPVGRMQIIASRSSFRTKAFHARVLEDGAVPLTFLLAKIRNWSAGGS